MKTIILFLVISFLLVADSIKVDLTVTFYDLTLEQATELEKIINKEFKDYSFDINIPEKKEIFDIWNLKYQPINDWITYPILKYDTLDWDIKYDEQKGIWK